MSAMFAMALALSACKGDAGDAGSATASAAASTPKPASTDEPDDLATSSVANKITAADFKAYIAGSTTVTIGKETKDGKFDVIEWSLHTPTDSGYQKYRTVFGEYATHAEVKAAYKESFAALKGSILCATFEVGVKRLVSTVMLEERQPSADRVTPCKVMPQYNTWNDYVKARRGY